MAFFDPRAKCTQNSRCFFEKIGSFFRLGQFGYLNIAQFLGAMNDNIFKLLVAYCFIQVEGEKSSDSILACVGAIYVIPFLLLSQTAGTLADRYSKRSIIVLTKVMELGVMLIGMLAFLLVSKPLAFFGLFLLASHSALFGPCKYGVVPELVPQEEISKANGLLTSCTYIAIIIGTFLASFLTEITERHFVFAAAICAIFSLIGLFTSFQLKKTLPSGSQKKVTPWVFSELARSFKVIRHVPSLTTAVVGSAYFLFVGSFLQLNMIPFAMGSLGLSDIQGGYLFLLTAMGIGAGSLLAGKFSGKAVELGLVPIGGLGMTICCFMLDYFSSNLSIVIPTVIIVGAFGGLYLVPLESFMQIASPKNYRGQIVATGNFLGFFGVLCSAGVLYILNVVLKLPPDLGFTVMGVFTFFIVCIITLTMSGYVVRFFSYLATRLVFQGEVKGRDSISETSPSFFLAPYSIYPAALILLASQRRRMRLFCVSSHEKPNFFARFFLQVIEVPTVQSLSTCGSQAEFMIDSLERGMSIAIFLSKEDFQESGKPLLQDWQGNSWQSNRNYHENGKKNIHVHALPCFTLLIEIENSGTKNGNTYLQNKKFQAEIIPFKSEEQHSFLGNANDLFTLLPQ